ncbi:MAG TPA: nuclear transport factor 2 family protein [Solirubrobacteraceae bacterium]|nr:nuclear transport factor 2 family protein [Solirubrobacteraceae bacterium]
MDEWIAGYGRAWEERDADAAAALFTEDALYRDNPYGEAHVGHDGVRAYWAGVTSTQDAVKVRFGEPIVAADERKAAVEFWVTMLNGGAEVSLTGILFLRFASDGRCEELREAWHFETGHHEPPDGWGR